MAHSESSEPRPEQSLAVGFPRAEILTRQYRVLRPIGRGGFAQVVLAEHLRTGTKVAVKALLRRSILPLLTSEWNLMRDLRHPNVVTLLQVIQTQDTVYLVTEYAGGGNLLHHLEEVGPLPEAQARRLFRQVVRGVRHCHQHGIVHRDLKPENLLLDAHGNVRVSDFGVGGRFTPGQKLAEFDGTLPYMAPEVVSWRFYDGPAADAWSLGVVLYYLVTGKLPFDGSHLCTVVKILWGCYTCPRHLSRPLRSLISRLLHMDPRQRPTMDQVLAHPWLLQDLDPDPEPAPEPLRDPKRDAILRVMGIMGHDPQEVLESLQKRKFDEHMATYLILQGCACQGKGFPIRVRSADGGGPPSGPATPPSPAARPRERTASAPAACEVACQPRGAMELGREGGRAASLPALHLPCQQVETQAPCAAFPRGPEALPSSLGGPAAPSSSPSIALASSESRNRGWKGVKERIAACFRALCCCLPARKPRVAPMKRTREP